MQQKQHLVGQSIMDGTPMASDNGIDEASVEGAAHMPYAIPNRRIESTSRAPARARDRATCRP